MKYTKMERTTLNEFTSRHKLTLEVYERNKPHGHPAKYFACFRACGVSDPPFLRAAFGNGKTKREAMTSYAKEIELKTIVVEVANSVRLKIDVPRLT